MARKVGGLLLVLVASLCCLVGCWKARAHVGEQSYDDLPDIMERGEIVVLTLSGSTSYFNYRGQEMGFQYELAEQFARSLGLRLHVKVARNVSELIERLLAGGGDLIAYNLPMTKEWKDSLRYCGEEIVTHQVLVQQAGGKVNPLQDVTGLVGKEGYVMPGMYYVGLVKLNEELGG
ncbi:MAG: transporter substrate-binding domain-containing protein, partial [Prevotellaceae bacterium]|nr:transporter substrate-binding domain-containing protein [Prevotellaceae bacterium]